MNPTKTEGELRVVSYIMARTSKISMKWWSGPLCTRSIRL